MSVLTPDLRAWLRLGAPGAVATVDRHGQPQSTRAFAVFVHDEGDALDVWIHQTGSQRFLESLREGSRAALNMVECPAYRSRTFKGRCHAIDLPLDESAIKERMQTTSRMIETVGMPPSAIESVLGHHDDPRALVPIRLIVEQVFDQSPRPGAGARL